MATLNLGRIKPVFRGAYAGGTAYVVDDIVTSGNETFICILASTGNATSNATYWTKLAAKGTDGTDLTSTLTTQGDILYRDGSGLQRLAKGTATQVVAMNAGATAPEWVAAGSGGVVQVVTYTNNTRASLGGSADHQLFTMTDVINKQKDATTSKIVVNGMVPAHDAASYFCGLYFDCLTAGVVSHTSNDTAAFKGITQTYSRDSGSPDFLYVNKEFKDTTNLGTGNHTFELGWRVRNGSSGEKPFAEVNPNSSDDARNQEQGSSFTFWEVLI